MPRTLARRTSYGLLVVFALLTPAAIVGTWAQRHLVDEQGYLQTVAPLSSDPRVQQAVASAVTTQVVAALPIAVDHRSAALRPSRASGRRPRTQPPRPSATPSPSHHSPQFASVWLSANQSAHAQLSEVLATTPSTSDVQLTLDLQPVVDAVQQHLVDNGFSFLRGVRIDVNGQTAMVTVPQSDLAPARDAWTVLHVLAPWLPLVVLLLAVAAIVLAPQRSWMLLAEAVTVLAAAGAVALAATSAHSWYVAHAQQSSGAAVAIGDALRPLDRPVAA